MNSGFWSNLKKPIFVLAPMANVTDAAFRKLIAKYGKPDVFWTEFVSVDGLVSEGREKLLVDFWYSANEHPIVAQIFGARPENFTKVAKLIADLGFDGIDINMGCPDRSVLKQGAGGALIKNPQLAQEIIQATKEGAPDLPLSIKTRLGVSKMMWEEWLPFLATQDLAAITVHLRTVKEMSAVPAHWDLMKEIVELIRNTCHPEFISGSKKEIPKQVRNDNVALCPLILGNGDILSLAEAQEKVDQTGCDGVMIGRGIFGNPWLFNQTGKPVSIGQRMQAMLEHTRLFEEKFKDIKDFQIMKKHYKAYINGFEGAKELRMKLMEAKDSAEVEKLVFDFIHNTELVSASQTRS